MLINSYRDFARLAEGNWADRGQIPYF